MRGRKDKMLQTKIHDPYMNKDIYSDPTICPTCGLVYHNKTWKRDEKLVQKLKAEKEVDYKDCPACRKIKDHYPLGVLTIKGSFINDKAKLDEVINLINHETEKEQNSNPLARVMNINRFNEYMEIETTTEGLATRLGKALQKAFQGELEFIFSEEDKFLRVIWTRDSK